LERLVDLLQWPLDDRQLPVQRRPFASIHRSIVETSSATARWIDADRFLVSQCQLFLAQLTLEAVALSLQILASSLRDFASNNRCMSISGLTKPAALGQCPFHFRKIIPV
jgi:hypothetical protein